MGARYGEESELAAVTRLHEASSGHEESLVRAFVIPHKRERLLKLLATPKGCKKLLHQLHHFYDLGPRFAHRLAPSEQTVEDIHRLLKAKGAPDTCYVMGGEDLDGRTLGLRDALHEVVGRNIGTFLSCIPGKLAYYEGENEGERYILKR